MILLGREPGHQGRLPRSVAQALPCRQCPPPPRLPDARFPSRADTGGQPVL